MWDDSLRTGATLICATVFALLGATAFWFVAARLLEGDRRAWVCRLGSLLVFVATAVASFEPIHATTREGAERCIVCGQEAFVFRILGLHVADLLDDPNSAGVMHDTQGARAALPGVFAREYAEVFADLIAPHDHRWHAFDFGGQWFRDLPLTTKRDLARDCVRRLSVVTDITRIEALESYESCRATLTGEDGVAGSDDAIEHWRTVWHVDHPDWP